MGDGQKPNLKDLAFKTFWTIVSLALPVIAVALSDISAWWVLPATAAINYALAWVRQRVGATPPDAPPT